jgi:P27 family predicted phage terminase small subunit
MIPHTQKGIPKAPKYLGKAGKKYWKRVVNGYDLQVQDYEILANACECLDRIDQARETIAREGAWCGGDGRLLREHPAQKTERDNKKLHSQLVRELCLDADNQPEKPRPPHLRYYHRKRDADPLDRED